MSPSKLFTAKLSEEDLLKCRFLAKYFFNRMDYMACTTDWRTPIRAMVMSPNAAIRSHVTGESPIRDVMYLDTSMRRISITGPYRIGSYACNTDGRTRWFCIDIDGAGHKNSVVDPMATARLIINALGTWANPWVEISGGGHGLHVWIFFEEPVDAQSMRDFILSVLPEDVLLANGETVAIKSNRGVEVFPKSGTVRPNGVGTMVWLPFWNGARSPANCFVQLNPSTGYRVLDVREVQIQTIKEVPDGYPSRVKKRAKVIQARDTSGLTEWQIFRMKALPEISPEIPYGDILTGQMRGDYLESRDPFAESGDQSPSAGISDGRDGREPLRFHSFITDTDMSLIDYLIATREDIQGIRDALKYISHHSGVPLPKRRKRRRPGGGSNGMN